VIFTVINVGGAIFALAGGEMMHAAVHAALLVGTFALWQNAPSRQRQDSLVTPPQDDLQLEHLQQSLDAIALEVERIGEGQRFVTKVLNEEAERDPTAP
jgi:hypothetical protein